LTDELTPEQETAQRQRRNEKRRLQRAASASPAKVAASSAGEAEFAPLARSGVNALAYLINEASYLAASGDPQIAAAGRRFYVLGTILHAVAERFIGDNDEDPVPLETVENAAEAVALSAAAGVVEG